MAIERVREYLRQFGVEDRIRELPESSAIELTIPELERYTPYRDWVDVCKGWEEGGEEL